jgi:OFA family oxalate/formate antiporter-like MFS transporter
VFNIFDTPIAFPLYSYKTQRETLHTLQDPNRNLHYRWFILGLAMVLNMTVSIYQYSWSLFAHNLREELGWGLAAVSLTFTIFQLTNFSQPFTGALADARGPRGVGIAGALMVGLGFLLSSQASAPWQLWVCFGVGGVGVGAVSGLASAAAIKWFPDRRGLASGLTAFGYGAGTAIFNWMIQALLKALGVRSTFIYVGLLMLAVLLPAVLLFKYPPEAWTPAKAGRSSASSSPSRDFTPGEMLRTPQWFLIYFCFTFSISTILIFAAQMKMISREFGIPPSHFDLLLILFPLGNGISRIFGGIVSDRIGRERTMVIFYLLLGLSVFALTLFGTRPLVFVILVFLCALLGGAPFALYGATIGDYYGPRYATTNFGITHTAKAWAGFISGWLCGLLVAWSGSYKLPLLLIAACTFAAGVLSHPRLLKPPRHRDRSPAIHGS